MDKYAHLFFTRPGEYTTAQIISILEADGYVLDHFAMAKGYIRSKCPSLNKYSGKFGEGYVLHVPNNETSGAYHSNRYHEIAYFVAL